MDANMSIEVVLVFIIASGWATLTGALSLVRYLDERRDVILLGRDEHGELSPSHRRLVYRSDWVPFKIVLVGFVSVTSLAYLALGLLLTTRAEGLLLRMIGCVVAIFGAFGVAGGCFMGLASYRERRLMREVLERAASPESS